MSGQIGELRRSESGQGLSEYALIIALVAVGLILVLTTFRGNVASQYNQMRASIEVASASSASGATDEASGSGTGNSGSTGESSGSDNGNAGGNGGGNGGGNSGSNNGNAGGNGGGNSGNGKGKK